jgi:sodium/proline symporter
MDTNLILPFIAYFSILLAIGVVSHKKQTSSAEFIVGNRSLNFWVTALSAHASDMSSWLFMAFPAIIFIGGLSQAWVAVGLLLGMFLNWQFVAKKLRNATEDSDTYTLSSFFEKRFKDTTHIVRIATALMTIFFMTAYIAAGLIGLGGIFESLFGINFYVGISIAAMVMLIYTFFGGYITVAWTDLFQAVFLIAMIVLVPVTAYYTLDNGYESILQAANEKGISLSFIPDLSVESIMTIVFLVLSWGLGYFGQPHILTKFMGINDPENMNKSKYLGMTWQFIALSSAAAVGLIAIPFFSQGIANPEYVFIHMVKSLFHPLAAGFILCGVLAAGVSTMDSQILVCASTISEDVYRNLFKKDASQRQLVMMSRVGVFAVSIISLMLALNKNTTIQEAVLYAWSGLGASFGPLMLFALYSRKANNYGAIAGIVVGGTVAGLWDHVNGYFTDIAIPQLIPGFILSALSIYCVSAFTERAKDNIVAHDPSVR